MITAMEACIAPADPKPEPRRDAYSQAVDYLTAHPDKIDDAWNEPYTTRGGILFLPVQTDPPPNLDEDREWEPGEVCGCLTQIRLNRFWPGHGDDAETPELTEAIGGDERIPLDGEEITIAHLPLFASWQRRIDAALERKPPVFAPVTP